MTHTDTQLRQALAKMLPEFVSWKMFNDEQRPYGFLYWTQENTGYKVLDTELLHLCWLVEETLAPKTLDTYDDEVWDLMGSIDSLPVHATWQQRTIALARVKGVEIV